MDDSKYFVRKDGKKVSFLVDAEDVETVRKILEENGIDLVSEKKLFREHDTIPAIYDFLADYSEDFPAVTLTLDDLVFRYPKKFRI